MISFSSTPIRCAIALLISTLFVFGCSSSTDSISVGSQSSAEMSATNEDDGSADDDNSADTNDIEDGNAVDTTIGPPGSEGSGTTRVNFVITVPVYVSNALQVRVVWGEVDTTAVWNRDELWTATIDFPVNTENQLIVTFSDGNGAIPLGSFEKSFTTGANQSETLLIAADEFDTDRWDSDGDGISNLSESIAGTNPQGSDALEPVQASLEFVQDKIFRISWQQSTVAQFYRVFENPDGTTGFTDISGELDSTTTDFDHRVALYARVNAQYVVQACNNLRCVDSDPLMVTGTFDSAIGYFKASNTGSFDNFGVAVSLSADGNTLAVGANVEDSTAIGINNDQNNDLVGQSGAVYVFVRSAGLWQQQAYIKANNTGNGDAFGEAVGLSADGNTLAVGAPGDDSAATGINGEQHGNLADGSGAVHVFVRSGGNWRQHAYIKASNTGRNQFFGRVVSLSANGNTLAVGAEGENSAATGINGNQNDLSAREAGAVYVFSRTGDLWEQQAYIKASNTGEFDRFGIAVSLSADGNTLAVGADAEDSAATGINGNQNNNSALGSGAVYVYVLSDELWQQQAYIKASNINSNNLFGRAVSLSADGGTLAVGASRDDSAVTGINGNQNDNSANDSGAVYVFVRSGELWQQQAYIKASNSGEDDSFGMAVSLSADGNILAVGTTREDSTATGINGNQNDDSVGQAGAVYVFIRSAGLWQQQSYIKASNTGLEDSFGGAVSLSADGNTLAAGAVDEDSSATGINGDQNNNSAPSSGAVYLY